MNAYPAIVPGLLLTGEMVDTSVKSVGTGGRWKVLDAPALGTVDAGAEMDTELAAMVDPTVDSLKGAKGVLSVMKLVQHDEEGDGRARETEASIELVAPGDQETRVEPW